MEQVKHHKLLGVQLDDDLAFDYHTENVRKKLSVKTNWTVKAY
jgi:hypothetical protein